MPNKFLLLSALVGALLLGAPSHAQTIYQQSFTGAATTAIGTAPTARPGTEVWLSLVAGNKTNPFLLNGNANSGYGGMYLPFTPAAGNRYKLSASIDRTSTNNDRWISVGFNDTLAGDSFTGAGLGTVMILGDGFTRDGSAINGPGATGGFPFDFGNDGANAVDIILDATNADSANWTMEYQIGGTTVAGPSLRNGAAGDFGNISFVGFSHGGTTGTIRDFSLSILSTIPIPPEPPPAPPAITAFNPVDGNPTLWETTLRADRDTTFEFRSSATLDFTPARWLKT